MSFIAIIPARYASSRLPGKMLAEIAGRPMICHVVDRANESLANRVIVATDDMRIAEVLNGENCEVCITRTDHQSGSDRLAEVVQQLQLRDNEIIVNVQGDEPLIPSRLVNQVASALMANEDAAMATAAHKILDPAALTDPNVVKVVFSRSGRALYFSRAAIPFVRDPAQGLVDTWHHIGIYAYRAEFLKRYHRLSNSESERAESLEQLRALDNDETIMVETVDYDTGIGVDTTEDLMRVRSMFFADVS